MVRSYLGVIASGDGAGLVLGGTRRHVMPKKPVALMLADGPSIRKGVTEFVLVNGRTPRPQTFCAMCCEPIGENYLREIATRLSYCDHECYLDSCKGAVPALQHHARA